MSVFTEERPRQGSPLNLRRFVRSTSAVETLCLLLVALVLIWSQASKGDAGKGRMAARSIRVRPPASDPVKPTAWMSGC